MAGKRDEEEPEREGYRPQPLERFVEGAASQEKIDFAREQRREGSDPEKELWECLRGRKQGFKFRRQHPLDDFVLDFFCHEAKLAVEIDGAQHAEQATYDRWRDERLAARGIATLRIPAHEVEDDFYGVLRAITEACRKRVAEEHGPCPG
jgi:very-short-patch-repair endonuclease